MIVFNPDLEKPLLIEAGAGTGKTWTIAGLYIRLIIEKNYKVNQILVVTFTTAATEELRERLRARLVTVKKLFETGKFEDDFEKELLARCIDTQAAVKRLTLAIRSFDEAAVYTIHGFCQKMLRERALESGVGFNSELQGDDSEKIQQIVDDYWRRNYFSASSELITVLLSQGITPETLSADIRNWIGKPWLELFPLEEINCNECITELVSEKKRVKALFEQSKVEITTLFEKAVGNTLRKNVYKADTFWMFFSELESYLENEDVYFLPNKPELFTQKKINTMTTQGNESISHEFFDLWELYVEQQLELQRWLTQQHTKIRIEVLKHVRTELKAVKAKESVLAYDDLLLLLNDALNSENGAVLARTIRDQFPAALIDEFQDTDPLQYNIFSSIYEDGQQPLILVGDPKQAIYSFRGADIHTYLHAKEQVEEQCSLTQNFRSSTSYIKAINAIFSAHNNPFRETQIAYEAVTAGKGKEQQDKAPKKLGALRIWNDFSSEKTLPKKLVEPRIVTAVANEIATMLNHASAPEYQLAGEDLQAGDIAVLVRKNKQGELVKEALSQRNIGCVQHTTDNVITSVESSEMAIILHALLPSSRDNDYRAALATSLFGQSAKNIASLHEDSAAWENWIDRFYQWRLIWQEQGFIIMFRFLLKDLDCYSRILEFQQGERKLTNFLHISELIHEEASNRSLAPESLLLWFNRKRQQGRASEEAELRLESEDNLVKIVTVHKSKGLQYGIIFCPFLWDDSPDSSPSNKKGKPFAFHEQVDDFNEIEVKDSKSWLVMQAEDVSDQRQFFTEETFSESLRLLYVALTRAEYHCTLVAGDFYNMHKSALGWLLFGTKLEKDSWSVNSNEIKSEKDDWLKNLEQLCENSEQQVYLEDLPKDEPLISLVSSEKVVEASAREFGRTLKLAKKVTSYSGITRGHSVELPDYDRSKYPVSFDHSQENATDLIRGREAGVCLHWILEHLDFAKPLAEQATLVKEGLAKHGFTQIDPDQISSWLQSVIQTPLDSKGFSLSDIHTQQRIDEMEFHFPLAELNQGKLKNLLKRYLKDPVFENAIDALTVTTVQGYLKGFIDLIFSYQDQYYLVDYKSNWLGAELSDYNLKTLREEIAHSHYYLQYLIYTVALHRYLQMRINDYRYEKHFAGAYYLFIRGMNAKNQSDFGIYRDKPPLELIESLSQLFKNGELV